MNFKWKDMLCQKLLMVLYLRGTFSIFFYSYIHLRNLIDWEIISRWKLIYCKWEIIPIGMKNSQRERERERWRKHYIFMHIYYYPSNELFINWFTCIFFITVSEALLEIKPLVVPEICKTTLLSGETIYSMVFKPHNFVPGRKYPTVLHIYGGPQVQLVCNTFKVGLDNKHVFFLTFKNAYDTNF